MRILTYRSIFILAICFLTVQYTTVQGQNQASSGSFYSGIGFGMPADVNSPFSAGMGLSGVSTYSGLTINNSNPAHWGLISFTQGNISANANSFRATDATSTANNALLGLESFQFAFPLLRNKLGASISFGSLVRSDFRQEEEGNFLLPGGSDDTVDYLISTTGSGGINRFELGLGYNLFNNISVGYAFSANVLTLKNEIQPVFSSQQFSPTQFSKQIEGNNLGHRFGIFAYTGALFRDNDELSLGASVTLPLSFDVERSITSFQVINNQRVLLNLNENSPDRHGKIKMPLEINTGLTYNFSRFVNVSSEMMIQFWDDAEYSFDESQEAYFSDRIRAGFGVQYHPYRSDQRSGLFSNFKYSTGLTYDSGHLNIRGQDIETIFLNAGLGIMSNRSASSIDLSLHYGIRGTESSNLVKENIWGFKLSLNLAEFMFVRQRFQ